MKEESSVCDHLSATVCCGSLRAFLLVTTTTLFIAPIVRAQPFTIRPTTHSEGAQGFSNPQAATDDSLTTVAEASASTHWHLVCTTPKVLSTTWHEVPAGYAPTQLTVRWHAYVAFVIYTPGYEGYIRAQVAYSADGGNTWTAVEAPFERTGSATATFGLAMHDVQVPLQLTQNTSAIHIRAILTVQMTSCGNKCNNVSHASGLVQIADIRLDADCTVPIGETSTALGWNSMLVGVSAVNFRGNLLAANGADFSGRMIREENGWDGFDYCAGLPVQLIIPTTPWTVAAGNTYATDIIGVGNDYIAYYQQYGSTPCVSTETQHMLISCRDSSQFVRYASNQVRYTVGAASFSVTRGEATLSKPFP